VGVRTDCSVNVLQHAVDIPKDIVVPVTQDSIVVRFENARALSIRSRLRCVLAAVTSITVIKL
jgi:hypothetical protein